MYVVTVLFETNDPGRFTPAILSNAASSLTEPGCRRFDVCFADEERKIFLYELYDDEAAFRAHLTTPHFAAFDAATRDIVTGKRVEIFQRVAPPSANEKRDG